MVNSKLDCLTQDKPIKSANSGHYWESRTADWVAAVAMIVEKNKARVKGTKKPLSEDASARDIDVVRKRSLSSQI